MDSDETWVMERRRTARSLVNVPAKIAFGSGNDQLNCIVIDWSLSGARIILLDAGSCPDDFTLITKGGKRLHCQVVWRQEERIGIRFV